MDEPSIRVLALTKYDARAASTRHRFLQFTPGLRDRGIHLEHRPLFSDRYLERKLSTGRAGPREIGSAYLERVLQRRSLGAFDLVFVYLEALPYLPGWCERLLLRNIRYVVDMDDAIFHQYDLSPNPVVRRLLGRKIGALLRGARAAVVGNAYLEAYARRHQPATEVIPTVVDTEEFYPSARTRAAGEAPLRVGWIGSPSTSVYLELLERPLRSMSGPREFRIVGAPHYPRTEPWMQAVPWDKAIEVEELRSFDVGVMPMFDNPWAQGKCAFKLIQYMAVGVPVIASRVGANRQVVTEDCGFLVSSEEEWTRALDTLGANRALRELMGARGRERVVERYSIQSRIDALAGVLRRAAGA